MVARSSSRPCCPEDVPMSRGRPHRRFRRLSRELWKMLGPRAAGGHAMFLVSGACNRALANTLLREPLITHRELTSALLYLSSSLSLSLKLAEASTCLASSSLLLPLSLLLRFDLAIELVIPPATCTVASCLRCGSEARHQFRRE